MEELHFRIVTRNQSPDALSKKRWACRVQMAHCKVWSKGITFLSDFQRTWMPAELRRLQMLGVDVAEKTSLLKVNPSAASATCKTCVVIRAKSSSQWRSVPTG